MQTLKRLLGRLLGLLFIAAGVSHFTTADFYREMVPPFVPFPAAAVAVSGIAEIGLGVLMLIPATRPYAAWGLVALLIAVFPANVYMAVSDLWPAHAPQWLSRPTPLGLWLRLPFQGVLVAWAWWYTRPERS